MLDSHFVFQIGHLRDFFAAVTRRSRYFGKGTKPGYSVLLKSWESFFTRRLYHRIQDCWNRPICSSPGVRIDVMERVSNDGNFSLQPSGKIIPCINLASYNYLGFADDWKETCRDHVMQSVEEWPLSMCSSRMEVRSVLYAVLGSYGIVQIC
jgi:serine palmitoyltransferase